MNPRVVKPNGTLLLLCEYHRCQQNRTKKRSDMKYRQHRAAKRQLARVSVGSSLDGDTMDHPTASSSVQITRLTLNTATRRRVKRRNANDMLPPADVDYLDARAPAFATSPPPIVTCSSSGVKTEFRDALLPTEIAATETMISGSPTTVADFESAASPWPLLWVDVLLPPASSPHLSPLEPPPASPAAWEPEELALLEYFIMS